VLVAADPQLRETLSGLSNLLLIPRCAQLEVDTADTTSAARTTYATGPLCGTAGCDQNDATDQGCSDVPCGSPGTSGAAWLCFWEAEMGKHDASAGDDKKDDDSGKDDSKDTSRHSVEHDKRTSTVPDPDDYK
jgi:hypothetical protein